MYDIAKDMDTVSVHGTVSYGLAVCISLLDFSGRRRAVSTALALYLFVSITFTSMNNGVVNVPVYDASRKRPCGSLEDSPSHLISIGKL
jgi:hypothetical protein